MSRSRVRDQIIVIAGGALLALFVILSWVPQGCPVVRRALIGCPAIPLSHQTPDEQEVNRVPHQEVTTPTVQIDAKAEAGRTKAQINFEYRIPDGSHAVLNIQTTTGLVPLATITDPLLTGISWHLFTSQQPDVSLYTKDPLTVTTVDQYLATKPSGLVADDASARLFKLTAGSYTPMGATTSLDNYSALLISYLPPAADGTWKWFQQQFDLSNYPLDSKQHLQFVITNDRPIGAGPLLLGEVHIDYRK